jgi:hypothetical protein
MLGLLGPMNCTKVSLLAQGRPLRAGRTAYTNGLAAAGCEME